MAAKSADFFSLTPPGGRALEFRHVDVFTDEPFTGNGLIVLFGSPGEARAQALISVTAEMRVGGPGP
jgi:hypothetical protein